MLRSTTTTHRAHRLAITRPHHQAAMVPKRWHGTHDPKTARLPAPAHDDIAGALPHLPVLALAPQAATSTTVP